MIVIPSEKGWRIYFHRAHALLAMKIATALGPEFWPLKEYWTEGLASIAEHDDGQPDWSGKQHLTRQGAPLDYRDAPGFELQQAKRAVTNAAYKSSFMSLLISLHCQHLHRDRKETSIRRFLKEQQEMRKEVIDHLGLASGKVEECYKYLRWCDELSLTLCQDDLLPDERKIETGRLPGTKMIMLYRKGNGETYIMDPWCFADDQVVLTVEYFVTDKLQFKSDRELKENISLGKPYSQTFVLCRESRSTRSGRKL